MENYRKLDIVIQSHNDIDASEPFFYGILIFSFLSLIVMLCIVLCCMYHNEVEDYQLVRNFNQQLIDNDQSLLNLPKSSQKSKLAKDEVTGNKIPTKNLCLNQNQSIKLVQSMPTSLGFKSSGSFIKSSSIYQTDFNKLNDGNFDLSNPYSSNIPDANLNPQKIDQSSNGVIIRQLSSKDNLTIEDDPSKRKVDQKLVSALRLKMLNKMNTNNSDPID